MTQEYTLKAMAANYSPGGRIDHLDIEVFQKAAAEIKELRAKLFPYADATSIRGMSWGGFYLIGDDKSIKELQRLEHRSAQLEQFSAAYEERVKALTAELVATRQEISETRLVLEATERNVNHWLNESRRLLKEGQDAAYKLGDDEQTVEAIAKIMHDRSDDDGCNVPWSKQNPRYRSQQRRDVRKVLSARAFLATTNR